VSRQPPVRLLLAFVAVLGFGLACAVAWVSLALNRPHAGWEGPETTVIIEPGTDAGTVLERLSSAGVIRYPRLARHWVAWTGGAETLHAGEYRFSETASTLEVLERLERGDVVLHPVTLPEGWTRVEIAGRLEAAGFGTRQTWLERFDDPAPIRDLDAEADDLEGYLFPDTYHFPRGVRPERVVATLVGRFREVMGPGFLEEAERSRLGLRGTVILASLIEEETSVPDERERISQVFHNRLERGMRLECDPTVLYALRRAGRPVEQLTYADLEFASPWNTYVVSGLPAGPISNPGRASLLAALHPSAGDDLYFVAAPGGGHRFSADLSSHRKAVAAWRRYVRSSR
jgi:UPF0755 protein